MWAYIVENKEDKLWIMFTWNIPPKKNSKVRTRWILLPSANYTEWHKRCMKWLEDIEFKYNSFPCSLNIVSIVHNNVKKDLDNYTQSIQDFLIDIWAIPDDNNFVMSEIHTRVISRIKNCPLTYVVLRPLWYTIEETKEDIKYDIEKMKEKWDALINLFNL